VSDDLILTNHHVLYYDGEGAPTPASAVEAWFGWEVDLRGVPLSPTVIAGDPATIVGRPERDWAVIMTAAPIPSRFPVLRIGDAPAEVAVDDRVYIIQHPGGRPKMIGMHHNLVRFVDGDVLQYWTDTEAGSSGSPVFDRSWTVVALHNRWGERQQEGRTEYYNQGQRIRPIIEEMAVAGVSS
jgi:V8-like Glu-specific endopeptidase